MSGTLNNLGHIILAPLVTEKTTRSGESENSVAFKVHLNATKKQIKKAVEFFFPKVKVVQVNTCVQIGRSVRFGKTVGNLGKWKKAIVKLAPGHEINLVEIE